MKLQPLNVLIIEDNIADYRLIEELVVESGETSLQLEHADALASGIERLKAGGIDVVLLDLNLRLSGGLETLKTLKLAVPSVPVVVLTGLGTEEMAIEAMRFGAQDYLVKGEVDEDLLVRSIRYAFERARTEETLRERESRLRMLTNQVPAILWTTDLDLRYTSAVGKGLEKISRNQNDLVGMSVYDFVETQDESHPAIAMHRKALAGMPSADTIEFETRSYQCYVEPLQDGDGRLVGCIGLALDVTEQRRMENSILAAQKIQEHLLPKFAPKLRGFDIAATCYPADKCSGDYYDFIPVRGNQLTIVIADAVGHGFGPAILAATVRSYLRAAAIQQKGPHEMLTLVNWLLGGESASDQFVTLFCCQLDPKSRSFVFASAGHPGYLMDGEGRVKRLESGCMPLGIEREETFQLSRSISLQPGDVLMMVTDGILEARSDSGDEFGQSRLLDIVRNNREKSAQELVAQLYAEVKEFVKNGELDDDVTVVIVKVQHVGSDEDTATVPAYKPPPDSPPKPQ